MSRLNITLTDQIPSGKNAMGIARTGRHYAKPRFASWRSIAAHEILKQKVKLTPAQHLGLPLFGDLVVTISYRAFDNVVRDLPGMQDALWHLLAYTNIIENDGQIKGVTWQYPWRTEGPCVEMEIRQA